MRYDAVILGGGPAGTATALSLARRGHRAAIVESSGYADERIGEALVPPARRVLEHLGAWERFAAAGMHLQSHATQAAWGAAAPGANPFVLSGHGGGWQLDRRRFDELLAELAAEAGAALHLRARLTGAERTPSGWRLTIARERASALALHAAFVVDATGRRARFAGGQGARKVAEDRLVAVSAIFEHVCGRDAGVLVEACRDGWWYSSPIPGERAVVALLSDADLVAAAGLRARDRWEAALRRCPHTLRRLAGARPAAGLRLHSARTQRLDTVAGGDWLAAGDAAATVDPLSSQGIVKALRCGIFASYAIGDALDGDATAAARYAAFVAAEHDDDRVARASHYEAEARWPDAPFWSRRRRAPRSPV